jgi:plastocyanin
VSRRLTRLLVTSVAGAALLSAAPAVAGTSLRKTVHIGDNYFTPHALTVKKDTAITWKWPGADVAGDVHDVKLKSGPKGAKKFHSQPASSDYSFKRKLTVPGTYRIICTLHENMTMKIVVKKPA